MSFSDHPVRIASGVEMILPFVIFKHNPFEMQNPSEVQQNKSFIDIFQIPF